MSNIKFTHKYLQASSSYWRTTFIDDRPGKILRNVRLHIFNVIWQKGTTAMLGKKTVTRNEKRDKYREKKSNIWSFQASAGGNSFNLVNWNTSISTKLLKLTTVSLNVWLSQNLYFKCSCTLQYWKFFFSWYSQVHWILSCWHSKLLESVFK